MMFNATFNNISVISWLSVFLEETGVSGENHRLWCFWNLAVRLERGRLPVENFIKSQTLLYFTRLYTTKLNPLLKESFLLCQNLDSKGIYLHMVFICKEYYWAKFEAFFLMPRTYLQKDRCKFSIGVLSIKLNKSTSLSLVLALFLALYKDIQVFKYVTSELICHVQVYW
jgi:hypothetical protein